MRILLVVLAVFFVSCASDEQEKKNSQQTEDQFRSVYVYEINSYIEQHIPTGFCWLRALRGSGVALLVLPKEVCDSVFAR